MIGSDMVDHRVPLFICSRLLHAFLNIYVHQYGNRESHYDDN